MQLRHEHADGRQVQRVGLEARRRRNLWYQCDAGDADTATFVHYLRIAAEQLAGKAGASLPQFTSEPQQDLARFALSFFRELFAALPARSVVVFDNFHEPHTTPGQRAAFAQGLDEVPEGSILLYSAHGVSPEIRRHARVRRLHTIDATCPLVTKVHLEAIKYAREGYHIILIGHEGRDEVIGTMGEAPQSITLVDSPEEVDQLRFPPGARLATPKEPVMWGSGRRMSGKTRVVRRRSARRSATIPASAVGVSGSTAISSSPP